MEEEAGSSAAAAAADDEVSCEEGPGPDGGGGELPSDDPDSTSVSPGWRLGQSAIRWFEALQ